MDSSPANLFTHPNTVNSGISSACAVTAMEWKGSNAFLVIYAFFFSLLFPTNLNICMFK